MTKEEFAKLTEQFNYGCDACSLGITVNGMNFMLVNCVGDGEGTVYIHDNLFVVDGPRPLDTDLILSFGNDRDENAEDIIVGLRRFDVCTFLEPVMILKGKHFMISRVRGTRDFVFDVEDLKIIRKPKSNKVTSIFDDDEYIDTSETKTVKTEDSYDPKKFATVEALYNTVKELGYDTKDVIVNISRTPLESVYGGEGPVDYGNPPQKYDVVGYGNDVMTPQGTFPEVTLLVRRDVASKIFPPNGN